MSKLVPIEEFQPEETLEELVNKTHEIAKSSDKVFWHNPHVTLRMKQRSITSKQMFDVLQHGIGIDGPKVDEHGDIRIKLKRFSAGKSVQVVVVIKEDFLIVVTVI